LKEIDHVRRRSTKRRTKDQKDSRENEIKWSQRKENADK
jgi:hypothetical protein